MSDHLPVDLVTRILIRLPVAAILRCRSVCRPWRELIDSPRFIKLQIVYSAVTAKNAILFLNDVHGDYVVAEYPNGLRRGIRSSAPPVRSTFGSDPGSVYALLGSCNGLLCFACDWEKVLILNPATRKSYVMPFTLLFKEHTVGVYRNRLDGREVHFSHGYGFGYDSVSDDYKVVQVVQIFKPGVNSLNSHLVSKGVRLNSSVDVEFPYIILGGSRETGVFVSGAIHWIAGKHEGMDSEGPDVTLVGFDLGRNVLREVPQPDYRGDDEFKSSLGELGKCLCIFADYEDKFLDVWVMKEYGVKESWSILFSVRQPGLCCSDGIVPLGFSAVTGDQEVLLQLGGKKLVWYDFKDPEKVTAAEKVNIRGLKKGENMDAVVCFGSLVSPYGDRKFPPPPKEEVKVDKQQQKRPGPRRQKRDDFLASGFKLKL